MFVAANVGRLHIRIQFFIDRTVLVRSQIEPSVCLYMQNQLLNLFVIYFLMKFPGFFRYLKT